MKVQSGIVVLAQRFTRRKLKTEARDCERRRRAEVDETGTSSLAERIGSSNSLLLGERTTVHLARGSLKKDPRHVIR